jgi:single-strand DNA-binding protein
VNRWTGTSHLTRDPELVTTSSGTDICLMRIAVKRAARDGSGYFDVKAFEGQARACADYLAAGREVAIEGRLRFEEFETKGGDYASRVYIAADAVEFLARRADPGVSAEPCAPSAVDAPSLEGAPRRRRSVRVSGSGAA